VHPVHTSYPAAESRFLPAVPDGFAIGGHEPLARGLRRVSVEQLDSALASMTTDSVGVAVHEVRKVTKRIRAVLRLVRPGLGEDRYRFENHALRDTAQLLAPVRDAAVNVESISEIRLRFDEQLTPAVFSGVIDRLTVRRDRIETGALETEEWSKAMYAMRSARARYAAWPVDSDTARAHGMKVIAHRFRSVGTGLSRTYARGRDEMAEAGRRPTTDNFHAWRKRAKYLRHQLEILSPLWPDVLSGHAASLERLGDLLGTEHDLAQLLRLLAARPDLLPDPVERSLLVALVQHRRAELQTASLALGARVYAEPTRRFTERLAAYWDAWETPVPVGFAE
jgi:CHAD domain-containing protein